jgi:putative intracellular protease/amidase
MPDKKIMMVLPPVNFDYDAFDLLRRILEGRGYRIRTTSIAQGSALSTQGPSAPVDLEMRAINSWEWDGFIFIGGEGARVYFDDQRVFKFIDDVKYKVIGATGEATAVLALAGIIKNKFATGSPSYAGLLAEQEVKFTNQPITVDERLITVKDNAVLEAFLNAYLGVLEG